MKKFQRTAVGFGCSMLLAGMSLVQSARAQLTSVDLLAGGSTVGGVIAFILEGILYMDVTAVDGYTIDSASVAAGVTFGDIPADSRGRPVVANFPIVQAGGAGVQNIFSAIPLDPSFPCDVPLIVAVQVTVRDSSSPKPVALGAWAGGLPFPSVTDNVPRDWCRERDRDRDDRDHDGDRGDDSRCDDRDGGDRDYDRNRDGRDSHRSGCRDRVCSRDCQQDRESSKGNRSSGGHKNINRSGDGCQRHSGYDRDRDCDRDGDRDGHHGGSRGCDREDDDDESNGSTGSDNATYILVVCISGDSGGTGGAF